MQMNMSKTMTFGRTQSRRSPGLRGFQRRAAALVIILGVLALLALLGLALIAKTHTEAQRVTIQTTSSSELAAVDGVILKTQGILQRDIWGDPPNFGTGWQERPLSNDAPPGSGPNVVTGAIGNQLGLRENNEPFDAPGEADIWLASNTPHVVEPGLLPVGTEADVLRWDHVSYIGSDINQPLQATRYVGGIPQTRNINPFMWASNSRLPANPEIVRYDALSLNDVDIIQRPVVPGAMLPGSTTNVSPRLSRLAWSDLSPGGHQEQLAAKLAMPANAGVAADVVPQFPYFDTNADGEVDLWDADGDGVPDSPLSMVIELDGNKADAPRRLYAAVRIVDHSGMINLNTASSQSLPDDSAFFSELRGGLQRRGRSTTEFLIENGAHQEDWHPINPGDPNRVAEMVNYRLAGRAPDVYDVDYVRRALIGGYPNLARSYRPYDLVDEDSLRHRNMLVRYDRADGVTSPAADYRTIDRALRNTLLWSPEVAAPALGSTYIGTPRWSRFNSDFEETFPIQHYEGYDNTVAGTLGWRTLMDEDQLYAVRKPLLTTVNAEVALPPDIGIQAFPPTTQSPVDRRLQRLWALGMDWPTLIREGSDADMDPTRPDASAIDTLIDEYIVPADAAFPADWMRPQPIDLNMGSATNPAAAKADFIRYSAAAMLMALEGGANLSSFNYQGMPLQDSQAPGASLNRQYLAWQFAVNLADYRDADSEPTYWGWQPTAGEPTRYVIGVEKQPFFTEAYAYLVAGDSSSSAGPVGSSPSPGSPPVVSDRWFFAFELFVPPGWRIPTQHLYFRAPGVVGGDLIPLTSFRLSGVTLGSPLGAVLDGGPADVDAVPDGDHGNYYVFCSSLADAPADVQAKLLASPKTYVRDGFQIDTTFGSGRLELVYSPTGLANPGAADLPNHVLDMIGPQQSGGELAANTFSGLGGVVPGSIDTFSWAHRPPLAVMAEGGTRAFSLRRSTKGWRFTTAWQLYSFAPGGFMIPNLASFDESLGAPNHGLDDPGANMNELIPESIWPALTTFGGFAAEDDFRGGAPYAAFDSAGDLSRMLMVGPVQLSQSAGFPPRPILLNPLGGIRTTPEFIPATVLIAEALTTPPAGNAPFGNSAERVAAGRVDFVDAFRVGNPSQPWTWRLLDFFTTQSLLHDGIDNDGDGLIDLEADPTEAADALFKVTGQVNLNTAPAAVLRSAPFSSLLPNSPTVAFYEPGLIQDPLAAFNGNPSSFWDLPTAIIAKREGRRVPLKMIQGLTGIPQVVAEAVASPLSGGSGPGGSSPSPSIPVRTPFRRVADLIRLNDVQDGLANRDELFRVNRFHSSQPASGIALFNHIIPERDPSVTGSTNTHPRLGLAGSPYSPDFRYRPGRLAADYVPIEIPAGFIGIANDVRSDPSDGGGVRGRDIFLSRLANLYSTRSDVFTVYIALIDEDGNYVHRSQITLDRTVCFRDNPLADGSLGAPILPTILTRTDGSYSDDTK